MGMDCDICQFKKDYFEKHCVTNDGGYRGLMFEVAYPEEEGIRVKIFDHRKHDIVVDSLFLIMSGYNYYGGGCELHFELSREFIQKIKDFKPDPNDMAYAPSDPVQEMVFWTKFMEELDIILARLDESDEYVFTIDWT